MAVYRNTYPLNDNTYTPPSVPSHIPISLEPVVGAPSDEELESAHGAARTLENLANSPFFDSAFSAKLSQHLFNIQFARYIQDSNQGSFSQKPTNSPPPPQTNDNEPSIVTSSYVPDTANPRDADPIELVSSAPAIPRVAPPVLSHDTSESTCIAQSNDKLAQIVGAPSDEELESAHGAVRIMENLANSKYTV
ncbi:unnamed protein product [Rhizoctonia solani]|uniref:Uncharacterized protein n=1 Tax=Rhizoctonia solani TaxID=456999 RepID=A0A8H3GFP7_9AGAM|nr:unnamed protein product [Rhizoctonia solani]